MVLLAMVAFKVEELLNGELAANDGLSPRLSASGARRPSAEGERMEARKGRDVSAC